MGKIVKVNSKASSYLPDWRKNKNFRKSVSSQKKLGGGVLLELSHELDYLLWFFKDIRSVSSFNSIFFSFLIKNRNDKNPIPEKKPTIKTKYKFSNILS